MGIKSNGNTDYMADDYSSKGRTIAKNTLMLYFVGPENKAYYQSPMFGRLLAYLQANPKRTEIRDRNGRRSFAIKNVTSVSGACAILQDVLNLDSI